MSSWKNTNLMQQEYSHQTLHQRPNYQSSQQLIENGPRAKCDQVVFEAIAKAAEIIVGSRCWIDHVTPSVGESSSSRRFNLLVPEVSGVRSILQRWKRALHVPLRLDVYYQHPDFRRELLERWCLEYAPKSSTHDGEHISIMNQSTDPIVQLRAVCKQIVIWLRSLYCWSRMLPSQALRSQNTLNNAIGFSIYVVSEGNDDVSGLLSQQGFLSQAQPQSVWTPYGELGWKVFYAPSSMVQRFIPERPPYSHANVLVDKTAAQSASRPIPTLSQQDTTQNTEAKSFHPSRELVRRDSTPAAITAHSAPQNTHRAYQRSKSDIAPTSSEALPQTSAATKRPVDSPKHGNRIVKNPPSKNLSALSLAMLTLEDADVENASNSPTTAAANAEAAERRRAALHHAPPLLPQSSPATNKQSPLSTAGEYGYAYNNRIPQMRPNDTPPNTSKLHSPSLMPATTPLGSTPPGYLLSGPTPPANSDISSLIPPRNAATPPFTRPMGFVGEPPSQSLPPTGSFDTQYKGGNDRSTVLSLQGKQSSIVMPAATSLDLLHSSPFRRPSYGSAFGSATGAETPFAFSGTTLAMDSAFLNGHTSGIHARLQGMDESEDMPFAVDNIDDDQGRVKSSSSTAQSASASSTMIIRDMCQAPKRLQLFESATISDSAANHDDIADQLSEFKSFGASLMMSQSSSGEILQT